jgi:thioredoxin 1
MTKTEVYTFHSKTCAPCQTMKPVFEDLKEDFAGYYWHSVDITQNPDLVQKLNVTKIPTMVVLKDGHEVGRHSGTEAAFYFRILRAGR